MPFVSRHRLESMQAAIRFKDERCNAYQRMMIELAEANGDLSERLTLVTEENNRLRNAMCDVVKEAIR